MPSGTSFFDLVAVRYAFAQSFVPTHALLLIDKRQSVSLGEAKIVASNRGEFISRRPTFRQVCNYLGRKIRRCRPFWTGLFLPRIMNLQNPAHLAPHKEFLLEFRQRYAISGIVLYVFSMVFVVYIASIKVHASGVECVVLAHCVVCQHQCRGQKFCAGERRAATVLLPDRRPGPCCCWPKSSTTRYCCWY
jgi:hypothetical protein